MYGVGIVKGMWLTFVHFVDTYIQDARYLFHSSRYKALQLPARQGGATRGLFTVEYPKEKLQMSENLRITPFLVYDNATGKARCTSCGICAKVCPPQCIWIERTNDPKTNRPVPAPKNFYIDIDICMNCGLCAEFCPFDAIKMDHDYEEAAYERWTNLLHTKDRLLKPDTYHYTIHPSAKEAEAANLAKSEKAKSR